jgi:hypothetical protein
VSHCITDSLSWLIDLLRLYVPALRLLTLFADKPSRYHESVSSFSALAKQTSELSQAPSALYDEDYPSMAGKGTYSFIFSEVQPDRLAALRSQLGLDEWENLEDDV